MTEACEKMAKRLEGIAKSPEARAASGEGHGRAKFRDAEVQAICDALKSKRVTVAEVADELGVCLSTIYNMWRGKTYPDVER